MFNHAYLLSLSWLLCFASAATAQSTFVTAAQESRYYLTVHGGNLEYSLSTTRAEGDRSNYQRFTLVENESGGWYRIVSAQTGASFDSNGGTVPYWRAKELVDEKNGNLFFRFQDVEGVRDGKFIVPYVRPTWVFDSNNAEGPPYFYDGGDARNRNHVWYLEKDGDAFRLYVDLAKRVSLTAASFIDKRPSVVILVHGVEQAGTKGILYPYGKFREWAADNLGKANVIDFDWSEGDPVFFLKASTRIGHRADQVQGQPDESWQGAGKLKELVGQLRDRFGYNLRISILAYSQGTVVTLSAMQEGLPVDNVVFMGSPIFAEFIREAREGCDLREGVKYLRGTFVNLYSDADDVVGQGVGITRPMEEGVGIGARGLPSKIREFSEASGLRPVKSWNAGKLYDVGLQKVDHINRDGWWSRPWTDDKVWPALFPRATIAALFGSDSSLTAGLEVFQDFATSKRFHNSCSQGFGHDKNRSEADWTFHMTKDMVQGFHFDDKDAMDYEIEVQSGAVKYDILHATRFKWEGEFAFHGTVIKAGERKVAPFRSKNKLQDATFWLRVQALEDHTMVRVKAVAKDK